MAEIEVAEKERFASRKFIVLILLFALSYGLAWFNPEFVGSGQNLFNFWILLAPAYFAANVTEKGVTKRKE